MTCEPKPTATTTGDRSSVGMQPSGNRSSGGCSGRRFRRPVVVTACVAASAMLAAGAAWSVYLHGGLAEARRHVDDGNWSDAVAASSRYLQLWPGDGEAILLRAEARLHVADEARVDPKTIVPQVIDELSRVDDASPHTAKARLHAARLTLMLLASPVAAERLAEAAVRLDPDVLEAHLLRWRIFDLTRRPERVEPVFRDVLRCSPPSLHAGYLRDWYLSQFAPATANRKNDRLLGVLADDETPTFESEHRRYALFRRSEPGESLHVAATAMLYVHQREYARAALALENVAEGEGDDNPEVLTARAEVAYERGRLEGVRDLLNRWPEDERDFRYWKWYGIVAEELDGDVEAACRAYDESLADWPGSLDWQLQHRRGNCLQRLGRDGEAAAAKARSTELELLISPESHEAVRRALSNLADPQSLEVVAGFYDQIGRPEDAALWRHQIARRRPLQLN